MRSAPDIKAQLIQTNLAGTQLEIIGGPICTPRVSGLIYGGRLDLAQGWRVGPQNLPLTKQHTSWNQFLRLTLFTDFRQISRPNFTGSADRASSNNYSYLSASTGSRLAARLAGYIPKNKPTEAEKNVASKIASAPTAG